MEVHEGSQERHYDEDLPSPTVLPWDQFSNWIHCCCVVTFDLELGQAMEVIILVYHSTNAGNWSENGSVKRLLGYQLVLLLCIRHKLNFLLSPVFVEHTRVRHEAFFVGTSV